jgi:hypothetical protein
MLLKFCKPVMVFTAWPGCTCGDVFCTCVPAAQFLLDAGYCLLCRAEQAQQMVAGG